MAYAGTISQIMACAAVAAVGAPITQIPLATELQTAFAPQAVTSVFRVRIFYEWLFILIALAAAPTLLAVKGPAFATFLTALLYLSLGVVGLCATREISPARPAYSERTT